VSPLVSIGVPVFNGADHIGAAFTSLLGQTHRNLELIVSDNCSTDASAELCAEWERRDGRVRLFRQARNIGAPANWNFVARQARGDFFKWASVSDLCAPEFIDVCLRQLQARDDAVLCFSRTRYIDEHDHGVGVSDTDFEVLAPTPSERFWQVCQHLQINNAQSGLIRIDALRRTRLDRLYPHGDRVLMAELALLGKFLLVQEPMLMRRAGPEHWTAMRSRDDLYRMFWPSGAPRLPMVHTRRLLDYVVTALRTPVPVTERLKSAAYALRYAYWRQKDIKADLVEAFGARTGAA
jgi:hypothetical protein